MVKADTSLTFTFSPNTTWVLPIKSKATLFSWRILWFWQFQVLHSLNLEADDKPTGLPLPHFPPFDGLYHTKFLKLLPVLKIYWKSLRALKKTRNSTESLTWQPCLVHTLAGVFYKPTAPTGTHSLDCYIFPSVSNWKCTWCGTAFAVRLFQCGLV